MQVVKQKQIFLDIPLPNEVEKQKSTIKKIASPKKIIKKMTKATASCSSLDKDIKPNYPAPASRGKIEREKTVKEILTQYEQEVDDYDMMPFKQDINPHILQTIKQRPFSASAKTMDLYNKNNAKTISELRNREKYKGRAANAVNVWLEQLEKEQEKSKKVIESKFKQFKREDDRLTAEINVLMAKIRATRPQTDSSMISQTSNPQSNNEDHPFTLPKSHFTYNRRPLSSKPPKDNPYITVSQVHNKNPTRALQLKPEVKKDTSQALISDDETFLNEIEDFEDFEMLSEDELS